MPAVAARQLTVEGRVLVAMSHPTMRALTCELLEGEGRCRVTGVVGSDPALADAVGRERPDLVVLDTARFPDGCRQALGRFPFDQVIVIGPEPRHAYRRAALAAGAGAWVARDRLADDLIPEVWRLLDRHTSAPSLLSRPRPGPADGDTAP